MADDRLERVAEAFAEAIKKKFPNVPTVEMSNFKSYEITGVDLPNDSENINISWMVRELNGISEFIKCKDCKFMDNEVLSGPHRQLNGYGGIPVRVYEFIDKTRGGKYIRLDLAYRKPASTAGNGE